MIEQGIFFSLWAKLRYLEALIQFLYFQNDNFYQLGTRWST